MPYRAGHVSGRGCTRPGGSSRRGAPSHAPVEAPCSVLADDTAEERLCPYTYGSAMLHAGDKQLRVAPAASTSGSPELSAWPHRNASPRGRLVRGLDTGAAPRSRPDARHPARPPRAWFVARLSPSVAKVRRPFERQGGLLSIATQEPNWSCSPSLLSSERLTAVEVCVGPGSADVEW